MRAMEHLKVVEASSELGPLSRAELKGWATVAMWGLRIYIVAMTALVVLGFVRGMH
ncbi:MAG: hypothetical protein K6U87_07650 [Firmicutes bacterium]|nr:hypothetical protein [Bacillota bacterium]